MSGDLERLREMSDEDLTIVLGHRAAGSDYPSTHPPLAEMGEPECSIREIVEPTEGAKAGDRVRYVQFVDSMYNAPSTPYFRSYNAAINYRGVDPGTLSGRQVVEARERDMEKLAKDQLETEMSCPALSNLRGATVHGHSLRLPEDGLMFDMLERCIVEDGVVKMHKDQVGTPIDKKVVMGKPMSEEEAAKRTTIYRVDNVAFRDDDEVVEWVHRVWQQRTEYGFKPE
jgi:methyl-coenzyme M reductase gamma subunit